MARHCAAQVVLLAMAAVAFAAAAGERTNVRLRVDAERRRVEQVLEGAARRFDSASCAELLATFTDRDDRPLADALAASGRSASAYLDAILFYDGKHDERCGQKWILAVTMPGIRVVKICPAFLAMSRWDPDEAEATLIHEALHTLGLGENPPSSRDITAQVLKHCR
jgi:hypothetical protein